MTNKFGIAGMQSALLVMTHPAESSLRRSVTEPIVEALQAHGYNAEMADLAAERLDPVFGPVDHAALPADKRKEQQRLDRLDHLIMAQSVSAYVDRLPRIIASALR